MSTIDIATSGPLNSAMPGTRISIDLLPGGEALLAEHQREMPQMNELCGAFWVTLALRTMLDLPSPTQPGQPVRQDDVGHAAWSVLSHVQSADYFPPGEVGRADYAQELPRIDDSNLTGTTPVGLVRATGLLSNGELEAVPLTGAWLGSDVIALIEALTILPDPCVLSVNVATRHFWGARPDPVDVLASLTSSKDDGPAADWDVGHFVGVLGLVTGPDGALVICADTYPSLGWQGLYLQTPDRLAAAMRRDGRPDTGGALVITTPRCAPEVRDLAERRGLLCQPWDNGVLLIEPTDTTGAS